MVKVEVRHHQGLLIEEETTFHEIPRKGDIIRYSRGRTVQVMHAEHTPIPSEGFYYRTPASVKVIVRWL